MYKTMLSALILVMAVAVAFAQEKPRVFVADSQSWEMGGGFSTAKHGEGGGGFNGGARPQTVEIMKTFHERCPGVVITSDKTKADFVVLLDHEGGKGILRDNKVAVFNRDGDMIQTSSTRVLGNAVKDACAVMVQVAGR